MSKKYQARDDTNRNHKITVRFSEDEYHQLNFICEVLGITYSQYLRRAALTRRIEHPTICATFSDDAAQKLTGQMGKETLNKSLGWMSEDVFCQPGIKDRRNTDVFQGILDPDGGKQTAQTP